MKKRAIVAVFLGISFLGAFAAFAQPPPVIMHDQPAAFCSNLTVIQPVTSAAAREFVPATHVVIPAQTRASPVLIAQLRPNGDGNQPGGVCDIYVASLRPGLALDHEKGFIQPATAASDDKGAISDVLVASLIRPLPGSEKSA